MAGTGSPQYPAGELNVVDDLGLLTVSTDNTMKTWHIAPATQATGSRLRAHKRLLAKTNRHNEAFLTHKNCTPAGDF